MYRILFAALIFLNCNGTNKNSNNEWITLFDGSSLQHWKSSTDNPSTFRLDSGMLIIHGPRAHLFYNGDVMDHNFRNFELKVTLMTKPGANSGIYFHTTYQADGWPSKGYEVQVNNSHTDWRRSGSLYGIVDIKENYANDNEWFTEHIIVKDKRIIIKVNDKIVVDYTEPEDVQKTENRKQRVLSSGTFALQGHDPSSIIYYKQVLVKPL